MEEKASNSPPKTTRRSVEQLALDLLGKSFENVNQIERRVLERVHLRQLASTNLLDVIRRDSDFGDRLADKVAKIGGSWGFILFFGLVLAGWMLLNSRVLDALGIVFDPYPFIFLNLVLSTLAAIQAPIIMMSQNRSANKDRMAAQLDYEVNLRNEIEIERLHEKIDELMKTLDKS